MSEKRALVKSTLAVTLVVFASKAVGFVREMIMAGYFGSNAVTDAYNSAYSLFYLPVLLLSSGITSTLMPEYLRAEKELGAQGANRFGSGAFNMFALLSIAISAVMFAFARPLVKLIYPGFDGEKLELTVRLTRIMLPALAGFVGAVALASILNAKQKYVAAQLTGFPLSVALIGAAICFSDKYGIEAQAWGIIAAGIGQLIILVPFLRGRFRYSPVCSFKDGRLKALVLLALPAVLSMAVNELNHMIDRMLASGLNDGDISAMSYAFKLIMFMTGVLVVPLTTVSFAKLSKQKLENNRAEVAEQTRESIKLLLTAIIPIVIIAAVASRQVIRFAYARGAFTEENVAVTGAVFLFYVVGVPFFGLRDLLNRVYHAFGDTRTPMVIAIISMALNVVLNLILRIFMGVNGLALSTGIAALAGVILLIMRMSRILPGVFTGAFVKDLGKVLLANIPVFIVAYAFAHFVPDAFGTLKLFVWLALMAVAALSVYGISALALTGLSLKKLAKKILKR